MFFITSDICHAVDKCVGASSGFLSSAESVVTIVVGIVSVVAAGFSVHSWRQGEKARNDHDQKIEYDHLYGTTLRGALRGFETFLSQLKSLLMTVDNIDHTIVSDNANAMLEDARRYSTAISRIWDKVCYLSDVDGRANAGDRLGDKIYDLSLEMLESLILVNGETNIAYASICVAKQKYANLEGVFDLLLKDEGVVRSKYSKR